MAPRAIELVVAMGLRYVDSAEFMGNPEDVSRTYAGYSRIYVTASRDHILGAGVGLPGSGARDEIRVFIGMAPKAKIFVVPRKVSSPHTQGFVEPKAPGIYAVRKFKEF